MLSNSKFTFWLKMALSALFASHGTLAYLASNNFASEWRMWFVVLFPALAASTVGWILKSIFVLDLIVAAAIWFPKTSRYIIFWALFWTTMTAVLRVIVYWAPDPVLAAKAIGEMLKRTLNVGGTFALLLMLYPQLSSRLRGAWGSPSFILRFSMVFWFIGKGLVEFEEQKDLMHAMIHYPFVSNLESISWIPYAFFFFAFISYLLYFVAPSFLRFKSSGLLIWLVMVLSFIPEVIVWTQGRPFWIMAIEHINIFIVFELANQVESLEKKRTERLSLSFQ
ncbi:MAG: hypothetical protein KUL82_10545 [Bdellovibrio sp.]|nr:hypothetical protein [Bdellovibrio sp.]